jgi:7-cyano-7-deazaguanine synthase
MVGEALSIYPAVLPVYVRTGMNWEADELKFLERFLNGIRTDALKELTILDLPVKDLYAAHWSITGSGVPDEKSPDAAVFLPGRNVLLLAKVLIWCHMHAIPEVAMATLAANPFPDATPEFFNMFSAAVSMAMDGHVRVLTPYARLSKSQVLQHAGNMPLQDTFSCIAPENGLHCGKCNKCAEKQKAFREAKLPDPTKYARG